MRSLWWFTALASLAVLPATHDAGPAAPARPQGTPRPAKPPADGRQGTLPPLLPQEKADPALMDAPITLPKKVRPEVPVTATLKWTVQREPAAAAPARRPRLAITPPAYDDMGQLLKRLGAGYAFTELSLAALRAPKALKDVDILFLTCGESNAPDVPLVRALKGFVERGGTLYASDLRFDFLARAFWSNYDAKLAKTLHQQGIPPQEISARVVDPGLRRILGKSVALKFDSPDWRPATFDKKRVKTYLEGHVLTAEERGYDVPLLVKFRAGKGQVIFTSFHNAAQASDVQLKLLQYLVFATVNAQVEAQVSQATTAAGFTVRELKTLNISAGMSLAKQTFRHAKAGPLRFALGFGGAGAKLHLRLVAPGGAVVEHRDTATFAVEVPDAPAGEWQVSVTGVAVPYPNYPYTLGIGERGDGK